MDFFQRFSLRRIYQRNKQLILFIILMSLFRSAFADWYTVPTGSMQPTIQAGDRIVVNKMAYDFRIPFTKVSLINTDEPSAGDIIVFESDAAQLRLIKRVVGLPGDTVAMRDEVLYINGQAQKQHVELKSKAAADIATTLLYQEKLAGITHKIQIDESASDRLGNFGPVTVPENHYLVLGDNRRHSADSRVYGFVPRNELTGKAISIAFSVDYENYYLPKPDRFFKSLYES